jgi:hypothetical protein
MIRLFKGSSTISSKIVVGIGASLGLFCSGASASLLNVVSVAVNCDAAAMSAVIEIVVSCVGWVGIGVSSGLFPSSSCVLVLDVLLLGIDCATVGTGVITVAVLCIGRLGTKSNGGANNVVGGVSGMLAQCKGEIVDAMWGDSCCGLWCYDGGSRYCFLSCCTWFLHCCFSLPFCGRSCIRAAIGSVCYNMPIGSLTRITGFFLFWYRL